MVTRAYFILLTVIRLVRAGSAVVEVTVVRGRTCDVISRRDGESGNTEAPKGSDLSRGGGARWMSPLAVPAVDVPGGCARWLWLDVPAGKGKHEPKGSRTQDSRCVTGWLTSLGPGGIVHYAKGLRCNKGPLDRPALFVH